MNLDLLIKFIRLANHNNADGEANTAARRVCKMLEEDGFKFLKGLPNSQPTTYNDVKRSTEPGFKSTPPQPTYQPPKWSKAQEDFFRETNRRGPVNNRQDAEKEANYWETVEEDVRSGFAYGFDPRRNPFDDAKQNSEYEYYFNFRTGRNDKREKKARKLKCRKCQQEVNTKFVGAEEMFICNNCQWTEWEEKRKKQETFLPCKTCYTPLSCIGNVKCRRQS